MAANSLDLLSDLIAHARAAGADAADAVLVAGTSLSVQRRLGKTEHVERSEGQDLGLRVFIGKHAAIVSSTSIDPAELRRTGRTRRRHGPRGAGGPVRRARRYRRAAGAGCARHGGRQRALDRGAGRPRRRRRGGGARGGRDHQLRGRRCRVRPQRGLPGHLGGVRRQSRPHQPLDLAPPRSPAPAPGCSATTTIIPPSTSPTWTTPRRSAAAPGSARLPGSIRHGRKPRSCRWSTTHASQVGCSGTWPARSMAPRSPAARISEGQAGPAHLCSRNRHPRRSAARARPALARVRRRGHANRRPRADRGWRADHLAAGQPLGPAAGHAVHRSRRARHRGPAVAVAHQSLARRRAV